MSGCPSCGVSAGPGDLFCRRCGHSFARAAVTETIPHRRTSNGRRGFRNRPSPRPAATATLERPRIVDAPTETMSVQNVAGSPTHAPREAPLPRGYGFPWGDSLALIGALAVIISAILDWGGPFRATMPRDISSVWLLDPGAAASGPSLGLIVLFAGTLGALVALISMAAPGFTFLRRGVGLLSLMIPIGFALRTLQGLAGEGGLSDLPSSLGVGVAVAAAGSLVQLMAAKRRA